jgi:drug/metabolite transporter (DMT)-like permease
MTCLFITLSVVFWASAFVAIRATLHEYNPIELAVFRFMVASLTLVIVAIIKKIRMPSKKDMALIFLIGFNLFINFIVLNYGALTITAGEISFILNTSPLFTALLAYAFLKEPLSIRFVIGLSFSFLGVTMIALSIFSGFNIKPGILFILLASITWAIYMILQKPLLERYSPIAVTIYTIWVATLLLLPFGRTVFQSIQSSGIQSTVAVIYLGIFPTVIALMCWSAVLSKIDASKASIFLYMVPVATIIIGFLWLHELPSLISCIGGIITIAGVIIANIKSTVAEPSTSR